MPVIECSCGMVMSVPAEVPRICCIRCGGVEFHILDRRVIGSPIEQSIRRSAAASHALPALVEMSAAIMDSVSRCSHS